MHWTWRYGLDLITGKGIWGLFTLSIKGVTRLKFKRRQPPLPSFPFPPSSSSLLLPLPFLPLLYPLEGLGPVKRCELPQWGLGRSPSRWLIWSWFEPKKRMALVTTLLWILNQNIFSFLEWVNVLVNFLVCRNRRGGNCLLVPHTSYANHCKSFRRYKSLADAN